MNLDDIRKVLDLMHEHDLAEFELEQDGFKVRVRKSGAGVTLVAPAAALPMPHAAAPAAPVPAAPAQASAAEELPPAMNLAIIKSPIVGTFYRCPEPGAPSFVEVGDRVRKGQVLCIIEAMKLMNEIESDTDGEITAAYVENGRPVQFGDRLFAVKVSDV
jgi:acetyl-CoA carboxylase biotin carboxyl carrier protein